uniref:Uncharacterized protein n=1 Tax=Picea glauca TaxID=3330 RepID=A0A117NI36_PICGL|nr:hypothetical protein ABT39_MTgene3872 [Picea glauca]QHR90879.1 hypothetical protein Q903MT_gene4906 [Picea sitchensis]
MFLSTRTSRPTHMSYLTHRWRLIGSNYMPLGGKFYPIRQSERPTSNLIRKCRITNIGVGVSEARLFAPHT